MNYRKLQSLLLIILFPFFMEAQPISQSQLLLSSDGDSDDMFGYSMAVSGNFAVYGTPQDDDVAENTGAAYIYKKIGTTWNFSEKIIADDVEVYDMFGESVDVDGDYIVVGSYQAVGLGDNTGAVYVYKNNGTSWEQVAKIFANDGVSNDNFGKSVAISGDYMVVGAPNEYMGSGATYIFHKTEETWIQILKIEAEDTSGTDHLGCSVDIDENYLVIGAWQNDAPDSNSGAAYVYYNNAGTWELHDKLIADDAQVDYNLGYSVAISGDYVVAGSHAQNGSTGAAYVFQRGATEWSQHAKLIASDGAGEDYFGKSVSISGNYVLIGAQLHSMTKVNEGAAYLYIRDGLSWNEDKQFTASDASDTGVFGYCVAIEDDFAFVSSLQVNGAVYVFGPEGASVTEYNKGISIYPNPANNNITFDFSDITNFNNYKVSIVDITGKTVLEEKINAQKQTVDISKLVKGIYFIKMNIEGEIFTEKIIVR